MWNRVDRVGIKAKLMIRFCQMCERIFFKPKTNVDRVWLTQISAGSSNPDDKFRFALQTVYSSPPEIPRYS
jgi:hypothetical protein